MLMQMTLLLLAASCGLEWAIVYYCPQVLDITERFKILRFIISILLSVGLGHLFGAEGVVMGIAAVASTFVGPMGYPAVIWLRRNAANIPIWKANIINGCKATWHIVWLLPAFIIRVVQVITAGIQWLKNNERFTKASGYLSKIQPTSHKL